MKYTCIAYPFFLTLEKDEVEQMLAWCERQLLEVKRTSEELECIEHDKIILEAIIREEKYKPITKRKLI